MVTTLDKLELLSIPEIQELFLNTMGEAADRAIIKEMIIAIEANDIERLMRVSGYSEAALNDLLAGLQEVFNKSGKIVVSDWPRQVSSVSGIIQPIFNIRNRAVVEQLSILSSTLISNITEEVRGTIRIALNEGFTRGENPLTTALKIAGRINPTTRKREGGLIGLSSNQTRWSLSVRRHLESGNNQYFKMSLRDKRFDSVVKKAFKEGKPLTVETIQKLTTAYNNKALRYRSELIARTETLGAINRASHAAHLQGIDEGLFSRNHVKKIWDDVGGPEVRHTHKELGVRNGPKGAIDIEEPFTTTTNERLMFPTDSTLGAGVEEIANCRCKARYKVDWLAVNGR